MALVCLWYHSVDKLYKLIIKNKYLPCCFTMMQHSQKYRDNPSSKQHLPVLTSGKIDTSYPKSLLPWTRLSSPWDQCWLFKLVLPVCGAVEYNMLPAEAQRRATHGLGFSIPLYPPFRNWPALPQEACETGSSGTSSPRGFRDRCGSWLSWNRLTDPWGQRLCLVDSPLYT